MTLPIERSQAIKNVEHFLYQLCIPKETPKIPKSVRDRARRLLKHFPRDHDMDRAKRKDPETWGQASARRLG